MKASCLTWNSGMVTIRGAGTIRGNTVITDITCKKFYSKFGLNPLIICKEVPLTLTVMNNRNRN